MAGSAHASMNMECDGSINLGRKGTWKGHVYPGAVFILWGSWWVFSVCVRWLWASPRRPYRARPWYPFPAPWLRLLEPALKVVVPLVAVSIELYFDHADGYRYLYCPPGTLHAGRFALSHMNNWQHAASYPAFVLSGALDLAGAWVQLPPGAGHASLAAAWAAMAFLMGTHEKHEPLDKEVHWLLFLSMLLALLFIALELRAPRSPLAGLGKGGAAVLQGAWLVQTGRIMFQSHPQWGAEYGGGAMFAPVAFCAMGVLVLACVAAAYALLAALRAANALPAALLPPEAEAKEEADRAVGGGGRGLEELQRLKGVGLEFGSDSAHDGSGRGSPCGGGRGAGGMGAFDGVAVRDLDV